MTHNLTVWKCSTGGVCDLDARGACDQRARIIDGFYEDGKSDLALDFDHDAYRALVADLAGSSFDELFVVENYEKFVNLSVANQSVSLARPLVQQAATRLGLCCHDE